MALFKKKEKPRTSQQKAQRAQMRMFARLAGCAFLVFTIYEIATTPTTGDGAINPTLRIAVIIGFSCAAAFLAIASVVELVQKVRSGVYNAASYDDDPGVWGFDGNEGTEESGDADEGSEDCETESNDGDEEEDSEKEK
ncbi:MAG: hypothetical protein FWB97_04050 [Oscillospiraceae bacterium]|nr:hypothetical protein [Oscillospiraceae bacterium]